MKFKKGDKPWNMGMHGKKYLKHFKDKTNLFKRADEFNEILYCKNCGKKYKRCSPIHYFCSINCQSTFWIKNNSQRYKECVKKWNIEHREQARKRGREFDKLYPEIRKANVIARRIKIPNGKICVICDERLAKHKHHEDYSKPLEVVFCCNSCHNKLNNVRRLKNE